MVANYDASAPRSIHAPMPTHFAPAKINLGLHVLRRRPDGYHDLDTIFIPIPWHDRLRVEPAEALALTCSDPDLATDDNLVLRAARALQQATGTGAGAHLHLEKHLPYGAGLGGGSSDAAAALRALCRLWNVAPAPAALARIARSLGADVPFFLDPAPARGTGIGDRLAPLVDENGDPYTLPYPLVVVAPGVHVSTSDAYRRVTPRDAHRPDLAALVVSNDLDAWRARLANDFEAPVCALFPALAALRAALWDAGAAFVQMTGSGSAFFGVFDGEAAATAAAEAMRFEGHRVWHGFASSPA